MTSIQEIITRKITCFFQPLNKLWFLFCTIRISSRKPCICPRSVFMFMFKNNEQLLCCSQQTAIKKTAVNIILMQWSFTSFIMIYNTNIKTQFCYIGSFQLAKASSSQPLSVKDTCRCRSSPRGTCDGTGTDTNPGYLSVPQYREYRL